MERLYTLALLVALALGACSSEADNTPCTPACEPGLTCSFGVCMAYCNPACGASQQCVVVHGETQCVHVDAGFVRDATIDTGGEVIAPLDASSDDSTTGIDATSELASETSLPDATSDNSTDTSTADTSPDDSTSPPMDTPSVSDRPDVAMDLATMDTTPDAVPPMDAPRDGVADTSAGDVVSEAPAVDVYTPPACGALNQPCCGGAGHDVACRSGLRCNAYEGGRCVAITGTAPLECNASSLCTAGRVCQGVTYCGSRACMRCAEAGMRGFGATCDPRMGGVECATGACITGRCSWACAPGVSGDAECGRWAPGTRCQEVYYGIDLVSMLPTSWITLGTCAPSCARNSDCAAGQVCAAFPSLLGDRLDTYCVPEGRSPSGASCTSGDACQSYLCMSIPGVGRRCTTPCVNDGDCPASQRCGDVFFLRPTSGAEQPARACLPR